MPRTDRNKQIAVLYAEGNSIEEIADILGYKKPEYVRAFLRDHNLLKEPPEVGIDVPKVLALQKAGWNMTNICDGCEYFKDVFGNYVQCVKTGRLVDYEYWNNRHPEDCPKYTKEKEK